MSDRKTKRQDVADWPVSDADIGAWTDQYFKRTREIVDATGDVRATYAVFMNRPVFSQSSASRGAETTGRRMNTAYVTWASPNRSTATFVRAKYWSVQAVMSESSIGQRRVDPSFIAFVVMGDLSERFSHG